MSVVQEKNHHKANVDPAEIAKFEAVASKWWDPESEFKSLHAINPLRAGYIEKHVPLATKKVLDVGCGGGILTEALAKRGGECLGIDLGEMPLKIAELHALETDLKGVSYRKISVEDLAIENPEHYDVITCMEMLEHVPDPDSIVQACSRLLKPGGKVFFSTLNRNPKSYLLSIIGAEYILKMLPKGTHDYQKFIKPSELSASISKAKLTLKDMIGMTYNPLTKMFKLGPDVDVNYIMLAEKPISLRKT
jgi:2-polyprenyl-6-hydroxyphenyl methylase/3-demethylubiquinone-9 3-methyltransferase